MFWGKIVSPIIMIDILEWFGMSRYGTMKSPGRARSSSDWTTFRGTPKQCEVGGTRTKTGTGVIIDFYAPLGTRKIARLSTFVVDALRPPIHFTIFFTHYAPPFFSLHITYFLWTYWFSFGIRANLYKRPKKNAKKQIGKCSNLFGSIPP